MAVVYDSILVFTRILSEDEMKILLVAELGGFVVWGFCVF